MHQKDYSRQYLTYKQVCSRYGIGSTTLYRWIEQGRLPEGDKIGPRARRWNIRDLLKWERERMGEA
ncbi:helix-turn-helix transcriptional regulator [Endozoicomonas sp. ALD040]|uniref:helix-turn-helix transcriptional regulator n=1 Tax=Endozoicomonas sp. ALD040 TaxID=3403079 RepID=UPI003BB16AF9